MRPRVDPSGAQLLKADGPSDRRAGGQLRALEHLATWSLGAREVDNHVDEHGSVGGHIDRQPQSLPDVDAGRDVRLSPRMDLAVPENREGLGVTGLDQGA
ncbi:MAG: hypothetical protein BWY79_00554 [Actinobacteria bacterium ADurb.Bin444]|nr:MAG: hypothetical protein BWY79_00554 [Actinobacteria bacterium ADurb.Bin444]